MKKIAINICLCCSFFQLIGCAHTPYSKKTDSKDLLSSACSIGQATKTVKGSVWLKAKSQEMSGQFPAFVLAQEPSTLKLEITNLVGGAEALISIQDGKYTVEVPDKKKKVETGYGYWGGIPLKWGTELFLGRIPCPTATEISDASVSVNPEGELIVETLRSVRGDRELFRYRFREWNGGAWPEYLYWERKGNFKTSVNFRFDSPADNTGSPKKWEATSALGQVKVRWRERTIE